MNFFACPGESVHVFVDPLTEKPTPINTAWREGLSLLTLRPSWNPLHWATSSICGNLRPCFFFPLLSLLLHEILRPCFCLCSHIPKPCPYTVLCPRPVILLCTGSLVHTPPPPLLTLDTFAPLSCRCSFHHLLTPLFPSLLPSSHPKKTLRPCFRRVCSFSKGSYFLPCFLLPLLSKYSSPLLLLLRCSQHPRAPKNFTPLCFSFLLTSCHPKYPSPLLLSLLQSFPSSS